MQKVKIFSKNGGLKSTEKNQIILFETNKHLSMTS